MIYEKKSALFFFIAVTFILFGAYAHSASAAGGLEPEKLPLAKEETLKPSAALNEKAKTFKSIGERFDGEELDFKISFWIFSSVARGHLTMEKESEGIYVVTFSAKTTGVARWLRKRKDKYIERIEELDGGRRFRTLSLEEHSKIGSKKRKTITTIDHKEGVMSWTKWKNDKFRKTESLVIPEGRNYDGPFTAFYNFRYGAYGDITHDKEYLVKTFPKHQDDELDIYIRLLNAGDSAKRIKKWRIKEADAEGGYMSAIKLDKELFDSKSGDIDMFFNSEMIPVKSVAKDIMLFGDVRAEFVPANESKD